MRGLSGRSASARILAAVLACITTAAALSGAVSDEDRKQAERDAKRYKEMIAKRPDDAVNYYRLGVAYITLERYGEAADPLSTYVERAQDDPKGHFWLGRALEEGGDCAGALRQYDRALEIVEEKPEKTGEIRASSLAQKGSCLNKAGRYEDALAAYRAALDAGAAGRTGILVNIGSIYNKMGQADKARKTFDEVVAQDPQNPTVHFNLGVVLLQAAKKDYNKELFLQAARSFARAGDLRRDAEAQFLSGEAFLMANDGEAALPHIKKYLEMAPKGPYASDAREYLAMLEE